MGNTTKGQHQHSRPISEIIKLEKGHFWQFLASNKILLWVTGVAMLVTYGIKVMWLDYSIDTEIAIDNYRHIQHLWIGLDRLGLVVLKRILFPGLFNPFLENVLTYITLFWVIIALCFLFTRLVSPQRIKPLYCVTFGLLFMSSPIIAEQLNFVSQSFEVCLGMLFIVLAVYLLYLSLEYNRKNLFVSSIFISAFAVSIYQSLPPFYVACVAGCLLLLAMPLNTRYSNKKFWQLAMSGTGAFIGTMAIFYTLPYIYYLLTGSKAAIGSTYLSSQIGWGRLPFGKVINDIWEAIRAIVSGQGYFYNHALIVGLAILILTIALTYNRQEVWSKRINVGLALIVLTLSPFLLIIAIGSNPAIRTNMPTLQFTTAFVYLYIAMRAKQQLVKVGIILIGLVFSYTQIVTTSNVLYLEHMKYEEDIALTTRFAARLDQLGFDDYRDYHLVVIGVHEPRIPGEVKSEAVLDNSFYEWDTNTFTGVSNRVAGFMISQGYPFELFDATDSSDKAVAKRVFLEYLNLPLWPQRGSVTIDQSDKVVVLRIGES